MKRIGVLSFAPALCVLLLACGDDTEPAAPPASTAPPDEEGPPDEENEEGEEEEEPDPIAEPQSPMGRLVIDEVYFTGSAPLGGADHYFSDQFIAIRNVSEEPVAVGGLLLGNAYGVAGEINPGNEPHDLAQDQAHVYLENVWRIPGAPEDVVLEPGERIVIAQDGTNHSPVSTVDLSGADFETFVESGNDEDYPLVPNLENLLYNAGFDWLITVFGPSVVIATQPEASGSASGVEETEYQGWTLAKVPVENVIDGVDIVMDANSGAFKRLPATVDQGFSFASGTYVGEAAVRRRDGVESIDTNDSTVDFEITTEPDPWRE